MDKHELLTVLSINLRRVREKRSLTQEALPEKVGISTSFYANIERGTRGASILIIKKLSEALEVSIDSLLSEDNNNSHMQNISAMLQNEQPEFIMLIEKLIRFLKSEA